MPTDKRKKRAIRCAYHLVCYLAEDLKCFGYKTDCPLYLKSNGQDFDQRQFDAAMDELITTTRAKYDRQQAT